MIEDGSLRLLANRRKECAQLRHRLDELSVGEVEPRVVAELGTNLRLEGAPLFACCMPLSEKIALESQRRSINAGLY